MSSLQSLLQFAHKIEKAWPSDFLPSSNTYEQILDFAEDLYLYLSKQEQPKHLSKVVLAFASEPKQFCQRILHIRDFVSISVAIERELNVTPSDDEFLHQFSDGQKNPSAKKLNWSLALVNLRSAFNIGSIFRTAEFFSCSHIYLIGYTADPNHKAVQKAAMGCDQHISWSYIPNFETFVEQMKSKNIPLVAMENSKNSVEIGEYNFVESTCLLLGNERFGLSEAQLKSCDKIVKIDSMSWKNSLNVASSFAIAAHKISRDLSSTKSLHTHSESL